MTDPDPRVAQAVSEYAASVAHVVESAYREGYGDGRLATDDDADARWQQSRACELLAKHFGVTT